MKENARLRRENLLLISLHPMSWLAVTFTTQEINSLRQPAINLYFHYWKSIQRRYERKRRQTDGFLCCLILSRFSLVFGSEFLIYNLWRQHVIQKFHIFKQVLYQLRECLLRASYQKQFHKDNLRHLYRFPDFFLLFRILSVIM